ncbi:unnamed protein product, partial [Prorocentrum cordatum]
MALRKSSQREIWKILGLAAALLMGTFVFLSLHFALTAAEERHKAAAGSPAAQAPRPAPAAPPAAAAPAPPAQLGASSPEVEYLVREPPEDHRAPECRAQHETLRAMPAGALPNTSVIFTFCNEPAHSLYNSIYSVIERSPRHLLHEFILVDDGSSAEHIQKPLEDWAKTLPVPVRIVRQGYRSGLMRARVAGAKVATGQTITVLDSHVSCSEGWLEPLMYRISQGREHVVMPAIDGIDKKWKYKKGGVELVGFNTALVDHGIHLQKAHEFPGMKETDPQPSPAMAGGLFSIHREYFFDIGAFDEGMFHWGGENIEIGFRVWQCGGSIELIKCSRVGHLWGGMGASCGWPGSSPGTVNKWRAIEAWMDPVHQDIMRHYLPYPEEGTGDISNLLDIRDKLKCKDFDYFLDKAYPECWMRVIQTAKFRGLFRNAARELCIDARPSPRMEPCNSDRIKGNNQYLFLTKNSELLLNAYNADMDSCIEARVVFGEYCEMGACSLGWKDRGASAYLACGSGFRAALGRVVCRG